ncbi:MAG: DUF1598 domain-containing protein [Thermogutta sp.]
MASLWGRFRWTKVVIVMAAFAGLCLGSARGFAQTTGVYANRAVGGVLIDSSGLIQNATRDSLTEMGKLWQGYHKELAGGLAQPAAGRAISLRGLEEQVAAAIRSGQSVPDEVACLGGITRIEYVLVYPDKKDIVLVGPAEPWRIHESGYPVGVQSGKPIILLDDLIVALRVAFNPQRTVISCSIDPTAEGIQRLRTFVRSREAGSDPARLAASLEQVLGNQVVTITGVPENTHFARVLAAADFRMKQISMGVQPAPVAGLPSFPTLVRTSGRVPGNMMPRWWLAPDYEPLLRDEAGLTWKFQKAGVKTLVEADIRGATGEREKTVEAAPVYRKWAELMTARYEDLAKADPVFGQVRNCMDLATVAALIASENLLKKADLELPTILKDDGLRLAEMEPAKFVSSKSVFGRVGRNWMFVTGGVEINAWELASRQSISTELVALRQQLTIPAGENWWSDAK